MAKRVVIKKYVLLSASLLFYAYWNWYLVTVLLFFIIINYWFGKKIKSSLKTLLWLRLGILSNLLVLFYYKYFQLFIDSFLDFLSVFQIHLSPIQSNIYLPIGISFFTFQSIGYLIDIYRNDIQPAKTLLDFAVFKSFFPQLIAGPIERAKNIFPQLERLSSPTRSSIYEGISLFAIGLFQKTLIGDASGRIVDSIYFDVTKYTGFEILAGLFLFSIQIYADFLGYSNMARGLGKFFGIDLMKNFNQPYFAVNIVDFWKRWHISLSQWLKDYLYIPLGGNRLGANKTAINVFVVMALGGLWHGASWNFLVWGIYHALLIIIYNKLQFQFSSKLVNQLVTFVLVAIGWLFFRVHSFEQFVQISDKLCCFELGLHAFRFVKMIFGFGIVLLLIDYLEQKHNATFFSTFKNFNFKNGIIVSVIVLCYLYVIVKKPLPFIYFQF